MNEERLVYLDHNATSPMKPEVNDAMQEIWAFPGNASSVHKEGRKARRYIEKARTEIAGLLNAGKKSVILFTSGATEANNLVLKGAGVERILVSAIEHSSILKSVPDAEIIPVDKNGVVDLEALDQMLEGNDRSTLISVMMVNNETGVIQPIDKVVEIAKKRGALVHTDAVQAAGRLPIDLQALGVDYLTLSAHKISGPQGVGCLVLSNCVSVEPLLHGGGQEKAMRSGTENLMGIIGFAKAFELAVRDIDAFEKLFSLSEKIETALEKIAPGVRIFGKSAKRVANTIMFSVPGLSSDTQMVTLDRADVCISSGSACYSGTVKVSHVLRAMGATEDELHSAVRVSLGWNTTEQDVDIFLKNWERMYERVKERLEKAS